jgi:hypothetical protein
MNIALVFVSFSTKYSYLKHFNYHSTVYYLNSFYCYFTFGLIFFIGFFNIHLNLITINLDVMIFHILSFITHTLLFIFATYFYFFIGLLHISNLSHLDLLLEIYIIINSSLNLHLCPIIWSEFSFIANEDDCTKE